MKSLHILVVNDDGPPSNQSSPYVHSLVKTLQDAGHVVSVVLPHTQRSWIGKAHMVGQTVKPSYFRPGTLHEDDGTIHTRPATNSKTEEWVLVDGTPASCVQIGLYHFFKDRGPIDLVVSGPNYGRNVTAVFSLSSGTLGGALEAAVCRKKAIAVSYAFESRNHDPTIIAGASRLSVKLIEYLYQNWGEDADVYTINVPLVPDVEKHKILWANLLQNYWGPRSCFDEIEDEEDDADEDERRIRAQEGVSDGEREKHATNHTHKHFKWSPRFTDVFKSIDESEPGNDGWAVKHGYTSVTPLKANYMHAASFEQAELKLDSSPSDSLSIKTLSLKNQAFSPISVVVEYEDAYVQPLILAALKKRLPEGSYNLVSASTAENNLKVATLYIQAYESLPFETILSRSTSTLSNAYIIRKALIRKNYLTTTCLNWTTKHPDSILATNVPPSIDFELDYAEFLDEALVEAYELHESFRNNEDKDPKDRDWWILKPGMSDRGQGIRLFSTEQELQSIFEGWEAERPDSDEEEDADDDDTTNNNDTTADYIATSHLRHFIAQPYIHPPLLLPHNPHKFHIRTYVLAVGSLKVYVYKPMLALFAAQPYIPPWDDPSSLAAHLTNTCFQGSNVREGSVQAFWNLPDTLPDLPGDISATWKDHVFTQICDLTSQLFEAAARGMVVHFQTLPNAFEVFGVDFMVDASWKVWLLEVNAFPDFGQTGGELRHLVQGVWEGVVDVAVRPFFGLTHSDSEKEEGSGEMVLVADVDLGRR